MRTVSSVLAAAFLLLSACGGPQTSEANNSQANISNDSRAADNATGSNLELRLSLGDATKVMHERHEGMKNIGQSGKAINRELTGSSADLAVVRAGALQIATLSKQASNWFPAGTGPEVAKTGAKPVIWEKPQDFAVKLHNFQVAAAAFNEAASSSDMARIKARFSDLEGTCKACHDTYRAEMHH
jgi:cytochrome c556